MTGTLPRLVQRRHIVEGLVCVLWGPPVVITLCTVPTLKTLYVKVESTRLRRVYVVSNFYIFIRVFVTFVETDKIGI